MIIYNICSIGKDASFAGNCSYGKQRQVMRISVEVCICIDDMGLEWYIGLITNMVSKASNDYKLILKLSMYPQFIVTNYRPL